MLGVVAARTDQTLTDVKKEWIAALPWVVPEYVHRPQPVVGEQLTNGVGIVVVVGRHGGGRFEPLNFEDVFESPQTLLKTRDAGVIDDGHGRPLPHRRLAVRVLRSAADRAHARTM
jgi:hypothetical protein